ncbi:MAG: NAD(P)H-hydrate dehydratase [Bdellovibrionales bacterium]|nr:NAD(P)H-hydrate dehydratase [Bdellovibrionales bacterium]
MALDPSYLVPVLSKEQIALAEKYTIETLRIRAETLMESAGQSAFALFQGFEKQGRVLVLCGPGNNGGDGLVFARYALLSGIEVKVLLIGATSMKTIESQLMLQVYQKLGGEFECVETSAAWNRKKNEIIANDWIIDAMFGVGLSKPLEGLFLEVVKDVKRVKKKFGVFALDIASGLDADSGEVLGDAILCDVTVSFSFLKKGFFVQEGPTVSGEVFYIPSTIVYPNADIDTYLLQLQDADVFAPLHVAHKGDKGHALIFAGSKAYSGAAVLSSLACQKSNTGLTTLAIKEDVHDIVKAQLIDVMSFELPKTWSDDFAGKKTNLFDKKSAILIGPGLEETAWTNELLSWVLQYASVPLVVDAGALSSLQVHLEKVKDYPSAIIITPHPGEMAKLIGKDILFVQKHRTKIAIDFATKHHVWVVLKGEMTLIASPDGQVMINPTGNETLSVGGTGDVLAGLVVSFLAQGIDVDEALAQAVWFHGKIGELRGQKTKNKAIVASELLPLIESLYMEKAK